MTMAWCISSSQKMTGGGWRERGKKEQEGRWQRAGWQSLVNREREAETTASGTGARGSPRTQTEVGDVCRVREDLA